MVHFSFFFRLHVTRFYSESEGSQLLKLTFECTRINTILFSTRLIRSVNARTRHDHKPFNSWVNKRRILWPPALLYSVNKHCICLRINKVLFISSVCGELFYLLDVKTSQIFSPLIVIYVYFFTLRYHVYSSLSQFKQSNN